MSTARTISEYSRQELYDLIWSASAVKLSTDFGISSVAIVKRCKRLNVPVPPRGYWAKVAAGQRPRKAPLPPTPDEVFKETAQSRLAKSLPLPGTTEPLLPLASELMSAIGKAKLDSYKRAQFCERTLPEVAVSKALAERVAQSFHTLLKAVESIGICFRKSRSAYDSGYFERKNDRLYLNILEDLVRADGSKISAPSYQSPRETAKPSGLLAFSLKPDRYGSPGTKQWSESAKLPLDEVLAQVVAAIRKHYVEAQERREQEAIQRAKEHAAWLERTREWRKQEAIRLQQEKERKHAESLKNIVQRRKAALSEAATNWQLSNAVLQFINECEARWKSQSDPLTPEQASWLDWARGLAKTTSPFSAGYPDPSIDGAFDPSSLPVGGPYPPLRIFR
jgi:hypothetical protein